MPLSLLPPPTDDAEQAFLVFWLDLCSNIAQKRSGDWVFRGHADKAYRLAPSIGRPDTWGLGSYDASLERGVLGAFTTHYKPDYPFATDVELLALGQHYGLPTRLLDWTTNLLAAAYFVVDKIQETDSGVQGEAHDRDGEIIMVRVRSDDVVKTLIDPFDLPFADGPRFIHVPHFDVRMDRQHGLFSLHPDPEDVWSEPAGVLPEVFPVPARHKRRLKVVLRTLGFSRARLIPQIADTCFNIRQQLLRGVLS